MPWHRWCRVFYGQNAEETSGIGDFETVWVKVDGHGCPLSFDGVVPVHERVGHRLAHSGKRIIGHVLAQGALDDCPMLHVSGNCSYRLNNHCRNWTINVHGVRETLAARPSFTLCARSDKT